jgi:hypothetical protein
MLLGIDPRLCDVPYYNFGVRLDSKTILYTLSLGQRLMRISFAKNLGRKVLRLNGRLREIMSGRFTTGQDRLSRLKAVTRRYLETSNAVRTFFDTARFAEILEKEADAQGVERLLIVCAYMESVNQWWSSLASECLHEC